MKPAHLRILETTDLHMHMLGFDYLSQQETRTLGLASLCPLIAKARSEADLTLLFDNGDFLQGNPLAEAVVTESAAWPIHPMIKAMNALDYDAITLGNHEFDYGLDYLQSSLAPAQMPIVCANLRHSRQKTLFPAWTVLTRTLEDQDGVARPLRIGVIGFVTPQIVDWDAHLLGDQLRTDDIIAAARTYLPQLRRGNVDLTVALCHSGISARPYHDRMENAALQLAALPGIDVVLAGHTHDSFPDPTFDQIDGIDSASGTIHGKPSVMAGAYGRALGVIDIGLTHGPEGWQVQDHKVALWSGAELPEQGSGQGIDPNAVRIENDLKDIQKATLKALEKPVTLTPRRLTSYFAAIGQDDTADLMAVAFGNHIKDALKDTQYAKTPVLVSTVTFRAGGHGGIQNFTDVPAGDLTMAEVSAIAPFNNPLCAVLMRGWQIRQWLEMTSGYFTNLTETKDPQPLLNAYVPHYHFDTLHGLRYRMDLRVAPRPDEIGGQGASRVRDLSYHGQPVQDDSIFVVAASSYRVFGGGDQVTVKPEDVLYTSRDGLTTILADQLRRNGIRDDPAPSSWGFVPCGGVPFTFATSPAAAILLADHPLGGQLKAGPILDSGFQQFILTL